MHMNRLSEHVGLRISLQGAISLRPIQACLCPNLLYCTFLVSAQLSHTVTTTIPHEHSSLRPLLLSQPMHQLYPPSPHQHSISAFLQHKQVPLPDMSHSSTASPQSPE